MNSDIPLVHIVHPVSREDTVMASISELELPADPKWEISRTRSVLVGFYVYLEEVLWLGARWLSGKALLEVGSRVRLGLLCLHEQEPIASYGYSGTGP